MPVIIAQEITASAAGQRVEHVTCEKCGTAYCYELSRVGIGKQSALYFVGQDSAAAGAAEAAQKELTQRLEREAEMVPCPKCHWVNQDLVNRYRRRQYRRAPRLILGICIGGFFASIAAGVVLTNSLEYGSPVPRMVAMSVLVLSLLSPAWVLLGRQWLRQRIDPNATFPRRPNLPPGTPPALIEQRDSRTGQVALVPVAVGDNAVAHTEWVVFRPGQFRLPAFCCMCTAPATTVYRPPFKANAQSDLDVPLCQSCSALLSRRWYLTVAVVALSAFALAWGLAFAIPGANMFGRIALTLIAGLFGALVGGVVIAGKVCRPYRIAVVDADRGIIRFAASDPAYTAMLAKQVAMDQNRPKIL